MITAPVRVVSIESGKAHVLPTAQSGCGGCLSRESCGVAGLGKYFSGKRKAVEVPCGADVHAGDELQLQMEEGDLIRAGLLAYLLPCVFALCGAGGASSLGMGDGGAVLGALLGMVVGLLLARRVRWSPQIAVKNFKQSTEGDTP